MSFCIAIVDHSSNPISQTDMTALIDAIGAQIDEVALQWDVAPPIAIHQANPGDPLANNEYEVGIWDNSDAPGAAGYHATDPTGKPYGKVFRDAVDGIRDGSFPLSVVLSHEVIELLLDKTASDFSLRADGVTLDAIEGCDAVEDMTYPDADTGVPLSNYLLPSAFDPGAPGPWDRMSILTDQYGTTPGGYRIVMKGGQIDSMKGPNHPLMKRGDQTTELEKARVRSKLFEGGRYAKRLGLNKK